MLRELKTFLLLPPFMFVLDYIWLGFVSGGVYKQDLRGLLRLSGGDMDPVVWAAVVVYLAIPLGIVVLALPRVAVDSPLRSGLFWGMVYGLIVYTIYEMTNYSLIDGWPLRLVFVDIAWGGALNAATTAFAALVRRRLG